MNINFVNLYINSIIISFIFFIIGSITNIIEVAVIGLLITIFLLINIIVFAMKDFGWFDKPDIVYIDKPSTVQNNYYNEPEEEFYEPRPQPVYQREPDLDFHYGTLLTGNKKKHKFL